MFQKLQPDWPPYTGSSKVSRSQGMVFCDVLGSVRTRVPRDPLQLPELIPTEHQPLGRALSRPLDLVSPLKL